MTVGIVAMIAGIVGMIVGTGVMIVAARMAITVEKSRRAFEMDWIEDGKIPETAEDMTQTTPAIIGMGTRHIGKDFAVGMRKGIASTVVRAGGNPLNGSWCRCMA